MTEHVNSLHDYGWNKYWDEVYQEWKTRFHDGLAKQSTQLYQPARVVQQFGKGLRVQAAATTYTLDIPSRFRNTAAAPKNTNQQLRLPVVGDWVIVKIANPESIQAAENNIELIDVLPSRCVLQRFRRLQREDQLLAANVDKVGIVVAADQPFRPDKFAQFLTVAAHAAIPALGIINKIDTVSNNAALREEWQALFPLQQWITLSAKVNPELHELRQLIEPGQTIVLLGASGVGKSTITNALLGAEQQSTGRVNETTQMGKQTTTTRDLILLPGGGLILDTPGLRTVEQEYIDADVVFPDLAELALACKYSDCTHAPNQRSCALQQALSEETITPERVAMYQNLL